MQRAVKPRLRIFCVAAILATAGCGGRKATVLPPKPPPRFAGVMLRIAADGPAKLLADRYARAWCGETGAKVVAVAPDATDADLRLIAPAELARFAAAGELRPLPNNDAIERLLPLYSARLVGWAGTAFALPVRGESMMLLYRLDAGAKPPVDWDEFAERAEQLTKSRGKPALPPLPADDDGLDREFHAVAAPFAVKAAVGAVGAGRTGPREASLFAFDYDPTTGLPRIDGPGFVEALKLLQRLQPLRGPSFADAALGVATLNDLAALRASAGGWSVARVPGSRRVNGQPVGGTFANVVPYIGANATLGVVPKSAAQPDAAFDLLNHLSGESVSMEVVHEPEFGSGPFRDSHLKLRPEGWSNYGLAQEPTARLIDTLRERADPRIDNPALVLRLPKAKEHRAALAAEVRRALTGGADAAEALKAAAAKWRAIDGDPAATREAYKRGLGL